MEDGARDEETAFVCASTTYVVTSPVSATAAAAASTTVRTRALASIVRTAPERACVRCAVCWVPDMTNCPTVLVLFLFCFVLVVADSLPSVFHVQSVLQTTVTGPYMY